MEHIDYFVKRILLIIPTFIGITAVCFIICQLVPGGPVEQYIIKMRGMDSAGQGGVTPSEGVSEEQLKEIRKHFGFDKPLHVRYWNWLVRDCIGFFMPTYQDPNKTAWQLISERFSVSLIFGLTGFFLTYLICIPLGISKALRDGSVFDLGTSVIVFIGYAVPTFAFGMILKMMFCGTIDWAWDIFPVAGFVSDHFEQFSFFEKSKDVFMHMLLPVLCYMIGSFAVLTLLMKNSLLEQVSRDYVRTILARGGSLQRAIWGHVLRNSIIPLATGFGSILTLMFAGSVLIEKVFEIPGMGRLSLDAIVSRDYAVFMGIVSITSLLSLIGNVLSDFMYVVIDPRINFQGNK